MAKGKRDLVKERFWRSAVERFAASGKSRAKFCADESLSSDMLVYWNKVIHQRDAELNRNKFKDPAEVFIPITVTDNDDLNASGHRKAIAEIVFAQGSILLFKGADSELLQALFLALRETTH